MFSRRDTLKISLALSAMGLSAAPAFAWETGEPDEKISCDILVIGSGIAGTVAALQAVEDGANVLMIDKASENQRGGNSRVCLGSFLMPENNSPDAKKAFIEDVKKKSLGGGRTDLYEVLADNILDSVKWAESNGAAFEPWLQQAPWNVGVRIASPGQYRGMSKLLKTLFDKYIEKGGKVLFKTKAKQLLVNKKGAVDGAICQTDKGLLQINAKAVILGTGGYSANREMLEAAHPGGANILIRGNKFITGDGIRLAQEVGAGTMGMAGVESLHLPVVFNGPQGRGSPTRALPYCLDINAEGKRFVDESLGYASFGKATLQQTGQKVALIFDEAMLQKEKRIGMSVELFKRVKGGLIEANGYEQLAKEMGVQPTALKETLEKFNASVRDGKALTAEPPKSNLAEKINLNGKLYAFYPLTPSITMVYGGLMINKDAQVTEADGTPIKGLYAAGETVNLYYHDYHGGGILSQSLVFGRIAANQAAKYIKQ